MRASVTHSNLGESISKAAELIEENKLSDSLKLLDSCLAVDPKNPTALSGKVIVLYKLDRFAETIETIDKLLQKEPNNDSILLIKGNAQFELGEYAYARATYGSISDEFNPALVLRKIARCFYEEKVYIIAAMNCDRSLRIEPQNIDTLYLRALAEFGNKLYDFTLDICDEILAIDLTNISALRLKGKVYIETQKFGEAATVLNQALLIAPEDEETLFLKSDVLLRQNRPDEALLIVNRLLNKQPSETTYVVGKFLALMRMGQYEEARHIIYVHRNNSKVLDSVRGLGSNLVKKELYADALVAFNMYLEYITDDVDVLVYKAQCLFALEEYESALEVMHATPQIDQTHSVTLLGMGRTLYAQERFSEALEVVVKHLKLDPNSEQVLYGYVCTLHKLGQYEEALKACNKYLSKKRDSQNALLQKATILSKLHRHNEVVKTYNKILKLNPNNYMVWYNQFYPHWYSRRRAEALQCLQNALIFDQEYEVLNRLMKSSLPLGVDRLRKKEIRPDNPVNWFNVAYVHWHEGDLIKAKVSLQTALNYDTGFAVLEHLAIGIEPLTPPTLLPSDYEEIRKIEEEWEAERKQLIKAITERNIGVSITEVIEIHGEKLIHILKMIFHDLKPTTSVYVYLSLLELGTQEIQRLLCHENKDTTTSQRTKARAQVGIKSTDHHTDLKQFVMEVLKSC